jgi:hypothetical protein
MSGDTGSYEILTSALGLLTATHADGHMAGAVTVDYPSGVPTDRSQMLSLVAGMAALTTMVIGMRAKETGTAPEETLEYLRPSARFSAGLGWVWSGLPGRR